MVAIVRSFGFPAAELQNLRRVPSTDELRPVACPSCGVAAGVPGALRIVGHGLYRRQILGLSEALDGAVVFIRRFFCRDCSKTTSVLPDVVHPRRWYAGATILVALVRHLLLGESAVGIRADLGSFPGSRGWKSLERWRKQLLSTLWYWKGAELGHGGADAGIVDRNQSAQWLRRLLNHLGGTDPYPPDECAAAAQAAVLGTAHSWPDRSLISRAS